MQVAQAAAEALSRKNMAKQCKLFADGQGVFVLAGEAKGGQYPEGKTTLAGVWLCGSSLRSLALIMWSVMQRFARTVHLVMAFVLYGLTSSPA